MENLEPMDDARWADPELCDLNNATVFLLHDNFKPGLSLGRTSGAAGRPVQLGCLGPLHRLPDLSAQSSSRDARLPKYSQTALRCITKTQSHRDDQHPKYEGYPLGRA